MVDAARLHLTDAAGAGIWHVRGIGDLDALPPRVLTYWIDIRNGMQAAGEPFAWWRDPEKPTAHLFAAAPQPVPVEPALCGAVPAAGWKRAAADVGRCRACVALEAAPRQPKAWGVIGDVSIAPDGTRTPIDPIRGGPP